MTKVRRVMVVGGAGFLGSHVADRLLQEGIAVEVVDNLSTGSLSNLATARAAGGQLTIHHLDVTTAEFQQLVALRRPDVVVNLAAFSANDGVHSVVITAAVIDAARRHGVSKVVGAVPAVSLYGPSAAKEIPLKESRGFQPDDETGVLAVAAVSLFEVARARDALEFTVLAIADVYGPRQRAERDPIAASRLGQPLERTLDLVYVDDVAEAVLASLSRGGGLVVNIGTGDPVTAAELARAAGHESVAVALRPRRFAVAVVRARIHLSWAPWTPLHEGLVSYTNV